jgi:anti-sigma factor RsiW
MTCNEAIDKILGYLDSQLTPATLSAFEAHLDVCAPCRAYLATYRRTGELVRRIGRVDLPVRLQKKLRRLLTDPRLAPHRP